jgi:uncharacterized membrane protein
MDQPPIPLMPCTRCQFQMPETAAFCPGCGLATQPDAHAQGNARAQGKVGALPENVAGALAYVAFLPAIVFLLVEPYRTNRYVRFHSVQCLLASGVGFLFAILIRLVSRILFLIPVLGPLLFVIVNMVMLLALLLVWLVLVVKAFQGEMFRIPLLGDFADRYADVL